MNRDIKQDFKVANIHSDILRMYAECGFWIFGLWLAYFFIKIPNKVRSVFGYRAYEGYAMCTIYLFITYLTDNTELYKVTQYFYILVVVFMAFDSIKNEKITVDGIIVNAIAPGPVATAMLGRKEGDTLYTDCIPAKRFATPSEIGQLAVIMVSDMCNLVIGDTFYVSGGSGTIKY